MEGGGARRRAARRRRRGCRIRAPNGRIRRLRRRIYRRGGAGARGCADAEKTDAGGARRRPARESPQRRSGPRERAWWWPVPTPASAPVRAVRHPSPVLCGGRVAAAGVRPSRLRAPAGRLAVRAHRCGRCGTPWVRRTAAWRRSSAAAWFGAATVASPGWEGRGNGVGSLRRTRAAGFRSSGRKPSPDPFWWNGGGAFGRRSPCLGRHSGARILLHKSLGENPVQLLDERRRRLRAS